MDTLTRARRPGGRVGSVPVRPARARSARAVTAIALVVSVGACASSSPGTSGKGSSDVRGRITVSAASSLGGALERITRDFERAHPHASVTVNLGPSSTLATQINAGAPADVFAAADPTTMQVIVDGRRARGTPRDLARNVMVIVTKPGNPERVRSVADLRRVGFVALCGVEVPCGNYAAAVLTTARVKLPEDRVTRQLDAASTLRAVVSGDADAALVYATDARSARADVATIPIPASRNAVAVYQLVALRSGSHPGLARTFVTYVLSARGQSALRSFGFLRP